MQDPHHMYWFIILWYSNNKVFIPHAVMWSGTKRENAELYTSFVFDWWLDIILEAFQFHTVNT